MREERRPNMPKSETLQELKRELHISHSQILTYLNCSLKYRFMYVEARPPERVSVALLWGTAIHGAVERYYRTFKDKGEKEPLGLLQDLFAERINYELDRLDIPVIFKKEAPDREAVLAMGRSMLAVFHASVDLTGYEVLEVERPLSARLYTDQGEPTGIKLVGVLDLVLRDQAGQVIAVDIKTAAKAYTQESVDSDAQLTCYSWLLASNRYVPLTADVECRFEVIRKTRTPKLEHYRTVRTAAQRRRFAKVAAAVLAGIDARLFMPQPSWMCGDCQFAEACRLW
jgi:putative RecB family exonuclease